MDVAGDADPSIDTLFAQFLLLRPEPVVIRCFQRLFQTGREVAGVIDGAGRVEPGELVGLDQVFAPQFGRVDAQLLGRLVHHPLSPEDSLGSAETAEGADRGLVGGGRYHIAVIVGDPVLVRSGRAGHPSRAYSDAVQMGA